MPPVNSFEFKSIPLDLEGISFDLAEGCLTEIKEIFFIEGKYAPIIRWCSFPQNDWPKPHQLICEFWRKNFTIHDFTLNAIEEDDKLVRVKPYLAIISKNNHDFQYDFMGDRYQAFHNITESKDTFLSTLNKTQAAIPLLNYTILAATAIRGQASLCLYQGGDDLRPELWNKLIMPLSDHEGKVQKFVICALKSPS